MSQDSPRLSERDQRLERARRAALLQHEAIKEANSLVARSSRPEEPGEGAAWVCSTATAT